MAGDWIKMRGGLFQSPKLIAMGRRLHECREFRDWMTPGGSGPMNGKIVSDHALRCVTGSLLCIFWSWSREFGKCVTKALPSDGNAALPSDGNGDCFLPHIDIDDLDGIAGAPGVGRAMEAVGWAIQSTDPHGVILPKFFAEHNIPLTAAEKQRAYRERKRYQSVTEPLPTDGNKTVTRSEKRREEVEVDHRLISCLREDHTLSAATEWCLEKFRTPSGGKPALFTQRQANESRGFLLRVAAIALSGAVPEAWAAEAIEGMRRLQTMPSNPAGYLRKVLRESPHIRGRPAGWFDALLKSIEVPS